MLTEVIPATDAPGASPQTEQAAEQRVADRELFAHLQADGFEGPRFDMLRERLWLYGWNVLRAWMRTGTIFELCHERHIMFSAPYTEVEEVMRRADVREDIAIDCLSKAVPTFMSKGGSLERWDPDGGRNLTSYFLHFALYVFRDAYRKWSTDYRRRMHEILGAEARLRDSPWRWVPAPLLSPENQVVLGESLGVILEGSSMEEAAVCRAMLITGATQEEIAKMLGITRKSVERRLSRVRGRARKLAAAGVIVVPSVSSAVAR